MGIGTQKSGSPNGVAMGPRTLDPGVPAPGRGVDAPIARAISVIDYAVAELQSAGASGGIAEVQLPALSGELVALVDRIVLWCDSSSSTTCSVFVGGTAIRNLRDYTPAGNANVADMAQPIYVGRNLPMFVRWEGASAGAIGIAAVQYRICQVLAVDARQTAGLI